MLPTEHEEQITFVQWLDLKRLKYWHTPNSTFTKSWKQKMMNKAMGVQAGIPDLFVTVNHRVVGIEMKRQKKGVLSSSQKEWIARLNEHGIETRVCKGASEAIAFVEEIMGRGK